MSNWRDLIKGDVSLHIGYGKTFMNDLYAYNSKIFPSSEEFHLSIDLNPNLRTRNRQVNTYIDARELADGEIERLETIQLFYSEKVLKKIGALYKDAGEPDTWTLTIYLEGTKTFKTQLGGDRHLISLSVVSS